MSTYLIVFINRRESEDKLSYTKFIDNVYYMDCTKLSAVKQFRHFYGDNYPILNIIEL